MHSFTLREKERKRRAVVYKFGVKNVFYSERRGMHFAYCLLYAVDYIFEAKFNSAKKKEAADIEICEKKIRGQNSCLLMENLLVFKMNRIFFVCFHVSQLRLSE